MTLEEMKVVFENHAEDPMDVRRFGLIKNPQSYRPDLCGLMMLDRLVPGKRDIISAGEHDQVWLNVDLAKLAEVVTEEDIMNLLRCGIWYDSEGGSLSMFV